MTNMKINKRRREAGLPHRVNTPINEIKTALNLAIVHWKGYLSEMKKKHEKKILDYYEQELPDDPEHPKLIEHRNRITKGIKRAS